MEIKASWWLLDQVVCDSTKSKNILEFDNPRDYSILCVPSPLPLFSSFFLLIDKGNIVEKERDIQEGSTCQRAQEGRVVWGRAS